MTSTALSRISPLTAPIPAVASVPVGKSTPSRNNVSAPAPIHPNHDVLGNVRAICARFFDTHCDDMSDLHLILLLAGCSVEEIQLRSKALDIRLENALDQEVDQYMSAYLKTKLWGTRWMYRRSLRVDVTLAKMGNSTKSISHAFDMLKGSDAERLKTYWQRSLRLAGANAKPPEVSHGEWSAFVRAAEGRRQLVDAMTAPGGAERFGLQPPQGN